MSTLRADTIQNTSGGAVTLTNQSAAKAWCTFDASSGTPTILDNINVTSLTDTSTGTQDVNFVNSFNNTSYTTNATVGQGGNKNAVYDNTATSSVEIKTETATTGADADFNHVSVAHHGDLA
jgi:hypothetical protein